MRVLCFFMPLYRMCCLLWLAPPLAQITHLDSLNTTAGLASLEEMGGSGKGRGNRGWNEEPSLYCKGGTVLEQAGTGQAGTNRAATCDWAAHSICR